MYCPVRPLAPLVLSESCEGTQEGTLMANHSSPTRFSPAIISAVRERDYKPFAAKPETVKCPTRH